MLVQGTGFNWPRPTISASCSCRNADDLREAIGRIARFLDGYRRATRAERHVTIPMKPIQVGLLGIGTVGGGTFDVLQRNQEEIRRRAGRGIEITMVADLDTARARSRRRRQRARWSTTRARSSPTPTSTSWSS